MPLNGVQFAACIKFCAKKSDYLILFAFWAFETFSAWRNCKDHVLAMFSSLWPHSIRNLSSHIDMYTHTCSALIDNRVTLTFDLLTSGSVHAERLPWTLYTCSKFVNDSSSRFSFRTRTHAQGTTDHPSHASVIYLPPVWVTVGHPGHTTDEENIPCS